MDTLTHAGRELLQAKILWKDNTDAIKDFEWSAFFVELFFSLFLSLSLSRFLFRNIFSFGKKSKRRDSKKSFGCTLSLLKDETNRTKALCCYDEHDCESLVKSLSVSLSLSLFFQ